MNHYAGKFDIVVAGAGHAGCEAALAAARMGLRTLAVALNLDAVALMACNPAIGGTSKGHLVREIDALGGQMALIIDQTYIQSRMLNTGKGPAVHSLRAQADKKRYQSAMKQALENQEGLTLIQGEVCQLLTQHGRVTGITLATGESVRCRGLIIASGVYLRSRIIIGSYIIQSGPSGLLPANSLSNNLKDLGFGLLRFKTGTPARVDRRSLDFAKMIPQPGDERVTPFSFLSEPDQRPQEPCWLTYTNERTHEIIRENLHRSPMYTGGIEGVGARYCPSIEDKVVRFHEKQSHQVFIEPEGQTTHEMYVQGMSSSLPTEVQAAVYRSVPGMEQAILMRPAYAIEYDCIDATKLKLSLESKDIEGLFFAGQINGSSGYEEAAAQGIMAGINAVRGIQNEPPVILDRSQAYIGVLIDDLVTKGTQEPYRMMTSRAEYRLLLRQDNADMRLTEIGFSAGLASRARYEGMIRKTEAVEAEMRRLKETVFPPSLHLNELLMEIGTPPIKTGINGYDLLKRPEMNYAALRRLEKSGNGLSDAAAEQVEIQAKYEGYIKKQRRQAELFQRMEHKPLPEDLAYEQIVGLRLEARQKLKTLRPASVGQASRISGVSPSDISVLLIYLEKRRREENR